MPAGLFVAGLFLVYAAVLIVFLVVLKPGGGVPLSRRRPGAMDQQSALTRLTNQSVSVLNRGLRKGDFSILNQHVLDEAGLKRQPGDYLLTGGAATLVAAVLGYLVGGIGLATLLLLVTPVGLLVLLRLLVGRRRRRFDEQVPDTLQMLAGGIRVGHSLLRAIDAAAQENDAPMSEELARVVNETRIGRDLGASLSDVAQRTASEDFLWIARAIEIHREVGGDLAEVLDHVGDTIRDRNQIRGQVRALSAEGRMSAMVLMALPVVMFAVLIFINPLYARVFTSTVPGFLMIAVALVLLSLGGLRLSRLIKPKF
ncbi:type II secretion system F family protein [Pseudarthrobacter sp. J75]|uniref:type II secretion system F family protein n=1 Tax=unclassified Pseudarthrobacter TaxID=2647000 RepID=UPI002E81E693|nr:MULTISPECIES: type II secretion system F family protein [unclassified Pseudarthrobacter]MEE2521187.1 type II secretion system F family protein [Pseudarthrobacter sp. J47]MEE2528417.1 type II secretion system F family protein [Pseudarthrobacter sp. J75]